MKRVHGKIILVDNEKYEKTLLEEALHRKDWAIKVEYFSSANDALEHLKKFKEPVFLVMSDMNMPQMTGLDFKKAIDNDPVLRKKAIPFIFASNSASKEEVTQAYEYRVQGYFKKPITVNEQAEMLDKIIQYWIISRHPERNDF